MQKSTPDNQKVLTATAISDKVDLETNNISRDRERRRQPVPVGGRRVAAVCEMPGLYPPQEAVLCFLASASSSGKRVK